MRLRDRAPYAPDVARPPVRLPGGARVALWVAVNVEHYEYLPQRRIERDPWPRVPHPDAQQYSHRDFGNRVGVWRLMNMLDESGIPSTISLNSGVFEPYPEIAELIAARDCAVMAHGRYNTEYVNGMTAAQEREWLEEIVDTVRTRTGKLVRGSLGPGVSGTALTPDVLAAAGLQYQADWVLDDQPTPLVVRSGRLVSIPYTFELNDARMNTDPCSIDDFVDACKRQMEVLHEEGAVSGRVMSIALHTFVSGQPHVLTPLRSMLEELAAMDGVWMTTADEIVDWFMAECYDQQAAAVDWPEDLR